MKAEDSFKTASELNPKDVKIWYEWINLEDNRNRYNIALQLTEKALEKTNNDVSILIQRINILKYLKKIDQLRQEIKHYLKIYEKEKRQEEFLRLVRNWKNIEYNLTKEFQSKIPHSYFEAVEILIEKETDIEEKIQLANDALRIAIKMGVKNKEEELSQKIETLKKKAIKDIPLKTKELNRLFNKKDYNKAKKEAKNILNWADTIDEYLEYRKNALRILLQIYSSEKDYDRIIITFEDYKEIGYSDKNCTDIYEKAKKEKDKKKRQENIAKMRAVRDASLFAMNLMLIARFFNLETHPMEGFNEKLLREFLNIEDYKEIPLIIAIGYKDLTKELLPQGIRFPFSDFGKII